MIRGLGKIKNLYFSRYEMVLNLSRNGDLWLVS